MTNEERIRAAWQGRISGCLLGKPVEMISMREGPKGLNTFLQDSGSLPLRNYVNYMEHELLRGANKRCCLGMMDRAEVDDDITYLVLALMMMEQYGLDLTTDDVARSWINLLPVGATFTAERDSYLKLIEKSNMAYQFGGPRSFDLEEINDGEYNDWIGAQIRIDMYGWLLPGKPKLAADLARRDAMLSHRSCAVEASAYIAALCALVPVSSSREDAVQAALDLIEKDSLALLPTLQYVVSQSPVGRSQFMDYFMDGDSNPDDAIFPKILQEDLYYLSDSLLFDLQTSC